MLVRTSEDAEAFLRWLGQRRSALAVDTETTGYHWGARLRLVQFGDTDTAWSMEWESHADLARRAVETYRDTFVLHNLKFDAHRLEAGGVDVRRLLSQGVDTELVARVLWPDEFSFKLKGLCDRKLGEAPDPQTALKKWMKGRPLTEIQRELKESDEWGEWAKRNGEMVRTVRRGLGTALQERARALQELEQFDWETVPTDTPEYLTYAENDVLITSRLYDYQQRCISDWMQPVIDFEHDVLRVLYGMERRGLRVDPEYAACLHQEWSADLDVLLNWFRAQGVENPNSNEQVTALLLEQGWRPWKLTKGGVPCLDKEVKQELGNADFEAAVKLTEWDRKTKWLSAYVNHFLSERDEHDRVHAGIKPIGARTSRMSVSAPPLHQLPAGDPTIRDCFIADDGNALVSVDYSQVEMRVAASQANEAALLSAIRRGVDLHSFTARQVYGHDVEKESTERKLAKIANFAVLYGAGVNAIALQANVSKDVARSFRQGFKRAYPALEEFMETNEAIARRQGYITLRDKRQLPVDRGHEYASTNYRIQGSAALVLKEALLRLRDEGLGEYMLLPVHDEVLFECPESEAKHVMYLAEEVMTDCTFAVPLVAEGTVLGDRWGNKYR